MESKSLDRVQESLVGLLPELSDDQRLVARSLYLRLANGQPLSLSQLAQGLGLPQDTVSKSLAGMKEIERDSEDRITAFRGLTLRSTVHSICRARAPDVITYTWCAFDTLFMAALLAEPIVVCSSCPQSRQPIQFEIDFSRSPAVSNLLLMVSFPILDGCSYPNDLRQTFCCEVHFFNDQFAAQRWRNGRDQLEIVPVNDALKLAVIRNSIFLGTNPGEPFLDSADQEKVIEVLPS